MQAALAAGTYNVPASAVASKLVDAMLGWPTGDPAQSGTDQCERSSVAKGTARSGWQVREASAECRSLRRATGIRS